MVTYSPKCALLEMISLSCQLTSPLATFFSISANKPGKCITTPLPEEETSYSDISFKCKSVDSQSVLFVTVLVFHYKYHKPHQQALFTIQCSDMVAKTNSIHFTKSYFGVNLK